jgi:hypothetical protein
MRARRLAPLAFSIALAWVGAGSAQSSSPALHALAVSDLIGRSPAEVREQIGARAPDHDYLSEVRLTTDGEIEMRDTFDMVRGGGRCTHDSWLTLQLSPEPMRPAFPRFVFRAGRLEEVRVLTGDAPLPVGQTLYVSCQAIRRGNPLGNLVFAPWAASVAVGRAPESAHRASVRGELARLRLGEPPPGGLSAYAEHPPAGMQVQAQAPGRALITVDLGRGPTTNDPALVRVEIADGRVVALSKQPNNFTPCWIEADRALHCGATAAPL